jgi:hypothetical protein
MGKGRGEGRRAQQGERRKEGGREYRGRSDWGVDIMQCTAVQCSTEEYDKLQCS